MPGKREPAKKRTSSLAGIIALQVGLYRIQMDSGILGDSLYDHCRMIEMFGIFL
jgi:hypothetical protein